MEAAVWPRAVHRDAQPSAAPRTRRGHGGGLVEERLICLAPISHSAWSIRPTLIGPGCQGVNGPWKPNQSADQREDRALPPHPGRRVGLQEALLLRERQTRRSASMAHEYNHHRPHTAIGGSPPITRLDNLAGHRRRHGTWRCPSFVKTPRYEVGRGLSVEQARTLLEASKTDRLHCSTCSPSTWVCAEGCCSGSGGGRRPGQRVPPGQALPFTGQRGAEGPAAEHTRRHSRRTIPLPSPCLEALRAHRVAEGRERLATGSDWIDGDMVFSTTIGTPIEPDNLSRSWCIMQGARGAAPAVSRHEAHLREPAAGRRCPASRGAADRRAQRHRRHDEHLRSRLPGREADGAGPAREAPCLARLRSTTAVNRPRTKKPQARAVALTCGFARGQGRGRTADLPLFRRTLVPTELPARARRTIQEAGQCSRAVSASTRSRPDAPHQYPDHGVGR